MRNKTNSVKIGFNKNYCAPYVSFSRGTVYDIKRFSFFFKITSLHLFVCDHHAENDFYLVINHAYMHTRARISIAYMT